MPDPLPRWHASYQGRGAGLVTRDAFAEPYGGDLRGSPRMVVLGLNPGAARLDFQARDGIYAEAIRKSGSLSAWKAFADCYMDEEWSRVYGPNRYGWNMVRFARRWLEDDEILARDLLTLELYPWHSSRITAKMAPPADIIDAFVWQPLAEVDAEFIFAFGKPWLEVCRRLELPETGRWGRGGIDLGSHVAARSAVTFALPSGQWVVVSWQSGYAGPPGREDALRPRERLIKARQSDAQKRE